MTTFSVKNFDRFQHYKDRSPPWIKLYNELLDDYAFGKLPDASKMHLVAIWLLASRSDNKIPYDAEWVAKRINATEPVNLNALEKAGFIIAEQDCSNPLADCPVIAMPEREERRVETEQREREKEERASAPRPTLADLSTWEPGEPEKRYAVEHGLDAGRVKLDIRAWAANAPASKRRKRDPTQFWQQWCRREADRLPGRKSLTRSQEKANDIRSAFIENHLAAYGAGAERDRPGDQDFLPAPERRDLA